MGAIPYAFSVHHFISSVGADAGFAAIIGLAILVLLYFAQARETASLRDQVADSSDQIQHLEHRLAQLARGDAARPPAAVAPVPAMARAAGAPAIAAARTGAGASVSGRQADPAAVPVAAGIPAAPAGVGAPALSAATRLIPAGPGPDQIAIRANGAGLGVAMATAGGPAVSAPSGPPPATAAGGANGTSSPRFPAPASAAPPAGRPATGAPRRVGSLPPGRPPASRSPRLTRGAVVLLGVLGAAAVAAAILIFTSGGGSSPPASSSSSRTTQGGVKAAPGTGSGTTFRRTRHTAAAVVSPSSVTVAVLNGTSAANLAHSIAARLAAAGFKQGPTTNASDQTQTATVVGYLPHQRNAAEVVARSLKLGATSVQPVTPANQVVACPASSTPCTAQVVVTVGADLASSTSTT